MYRDDNIDRFVVHKKASFFEVLEKLEHEKLITVFVIDEYGKVTSSITDGDVRRNLLKYGSDCASLSANDLGNHFFYYVMNDVQNISKLDRDISHIPVLDDEFRLLFVYSAEPPKVRLGEKFITKNSQCYTIAELGNNHQGEIEHAIRLIDAAKDAGADCVKFQHRNNDYLYNHDIELIKQQGDLSAQYVANLVSKFSLKTEDLFRCFEYAASVGLQYTCTPFDKKSLQDLLTYGLEFIKISSADFDNMDLINPILDEKKSLIISTGMTSDDLLKKGIRTVLEKTSNVIFLHCNSSYPTAFSSVNLRYMDTIRNSANGHVGYSGHEVGIEVPIAAAALGAKIIEKHLTLDRSLEGNDHRVSLLPNEFQSMVTSIRNVEEAMIGDPERRQLSQGEKINEVALKKGAYFKRTLNKNHILTEHDVEYFSPMIGLSRAKVTKKFGSPLKTKVIKGEPVSDASFINDINYLDYSFNHCVGVPVRYSEFNEIRNVFNLRFYEFHLSCHDIGTENQHSKFLRFCKNFSVHSPELFFNDHLIDLSSSDREYREKSKDYIRQVVEATNSLKKISEIDDPINIILNVGGFSKDKFLSLDMRAEKYHLTATSLADINFDGNNPLIQTMPPYPWHFGGRRYHNLFVDPQEIEEFCKQHGYQICFDTSHTGMAATHLSFNLYDAMRKLAPLISHIHIADFSGVDGEGVETGSGELELKRVLEVINKNNLRVPIVIEEWQGHLNSYTGFRNALQKLSNHEF